MVFFLFLSLSDAAWDPGLLSVIQNLSECEVKVAQLCPTLLQSHGLYNLWNSPGQNTGVGSCSLLQRIFPPRDRT